MSRPTRLSVLSVLGLVGACFFGTPQVLAEEFYCEVMAMEGSATVSNDSVSGKPLQEGDVLKVDDTLEVGADSYVDLAYDREWNNVTRVEENTKISIRSIYPTTLELNSGGVFAKLKQLPKESTFDVQTPTAIATVRGTEYRTTFVGGETQIYNVSDSDVLVYGLDEGGQKQAQPVILKNSQKTQVQKRGIAPGAPRRMETHDFKPVERAREKIQSRIQNNIAKGRMGKIQDVKQMESSGPPRMRHEAGSNAPERSLTSLEGGEKSARREPVKTLSGEDARRMAQRVVNSEEGYDMPEVAPSHETGPQDHQEPMDQMMNDRRHETVEAAGQEHREQNTGSAHDHEQRPEFDNPESRATEELQREAQQVAEGVVSEDRTGFDQEKVEQLQRKVQDAIENSPPEQRQALEQVQRVVHHTMEQVVRGREKRPESSGQPFGPDPGRRPQDADFRSNTSKPQVSTGTTTNAPRQTQKNAQIQSPGQAPSGQKQPVARATAKALPRQNRT